jgi:hypothetical protein
VTGGLGRGSEGSNSQKYVLVLVSSAGASEMQNRVGLGEGLVAISDPESFECIGVASEVTQKTRLRQSLIPAAIVASRCAHSMKIPTSEATMVSDISLELV